MGIQGLLPLLKSIHKPTHLRNFAGQTLGVDAYGWLHRGTVSCAIELAQQKPTRKHIDFALSRVRMLIHFGVKPYLVFDGAYLPSKEHTERERARKRDESKKLGLDLLSMGKIPQAYLELQKAIDVTPSMARELIEELKRLNVPYVVAPYEADSQLAYLEKRNIISGVISEDSDLLVFGVKCLLTKLDQYGECVMVNRADFTACREISLVGWTDKEFRMMAMLSGCDYLPGIDKMGLKTAYRLVRQHKAVERIIRAVQFDGKMKVPSGYLDAFQKAERTFLYQWVFCPEAHHLVNLNELPAELDGVDIAYIGQNVEPEIALGVAVAELDPNTKQRLIFNRASREMPDSRSRRVQTPDEKPGKPISDFFKPLRTPLAELDPNSFTPSPSQRSLLQTQQNVSWSASQAQVMRPPALSRVAMTNGPSSASHAIRRTQSEQPYTMGRKSPKRQRLCTEGTLAASMDGTADLQTTTSRFFSKVKVQPRSSLRNPTAQRRKTDDFDLWSDESVIEAMDECPSVSGEPVSKKATTPRVYADPSPEVVTQSLARDAACTNLSQGTVGTSVAETSQRTNESETPNTSFEVDNARIDRTVFSKGIDEDFAALKAKYGFQTTSPRKRFARANKSIPVVSVRPLQGAGQKLAPDGTAEGTTSSKHVRAITSQNAPSPKPRSEEQTAIVFNSSPPVSSTVFPVNSNKQHQGDDDEASECFHEVAKLGAVSTVKGSEDFLVPNSPESTEEHDSNRPKLTLGEFAFAGYS